jgi:hypothetical protein
VADLDQVVGVPAEELVVDQVAEELEQAEVQTIQVEAAVVVVHHLAMEQAEVVVVGELLAETIQILDQELTLVEQVAKPST